jgi:hypothetical protein
VGEHEDPTLEEIAQLSRSLDPEDRAWAAQLLASSSPPEASELLARLLGDGDPDVHAMAAQSLALRGDTAVLPTMVGMLRSDDGSNVRPLAWAVAHLAKKASPSERRTAHAALQGLQARGSSDVRAQVETLLADQQGT